MIHAGDNFNYVLIDYTLSNPKDLSTIKLNLVNDEQALKAEISLYAAQLSSLKQAKNDTNNQVTACQDEINI
ncbi:hypothetical protein J6W32_04515 [bacterium]|nr:hypothetical protein [bacterium]